MGAPPEALAADDYPAQWKNAPLDAYVDNWGYYTRECTSFVAWALQSRNGYTMPRAIGNASNWDDWFRARGVRVDNVPARGAIAQTDAGGWGHVAWVESVGNGTVTIEEYNVPGGSGRYNRRTVSAGAFRYIHVKDLASPPPGPAAGSPFGVVDHLSGAHGGYVQLNGWTIDPDARNLSGSVHVYVDGPAGSGRLLGSVPAANARPDVAQAHPGAGDAHGFSAALGGVPPGSHAVYVYAINRAGGGDNPLIGSATVNVPETQAGTPFGAFDTAEGRIGSKARVTGWTIDPDARTQSTDVHAYIDGPAGSGARGVDLGVADRSRPDVAQVHPGSGDRHGLDKEIEALPPGRHTVWLYAINAAGHGINPLLGTKTVDVPGPAPLANVDSLVGLHRGFIAVTGWAFDPAAPQAPGEIDVCVGGPAGTPGARVVGAAADLERRDVAAAYPGAGTDQGFVAAVGDVAPGEHPVYVYAINKAGGGGNPMIASATVRVPTLSRGSPFGAFDTATDRAGAARVTGWSVDPDASTSATDVHAYVDGFAGTGARGVNLGRASQERPDVASAIPGAGPAHGFDTDIGDLLPGKRTLWVYAINAAGAGDNPLLGVRKVAVSEPRLGSPNAGANGPASTAPPSGALNRVCVMPRLRGLSWSKARKRLKRAGCPKAARRGPPHGSRVRAQKPPAGTAVLRGQRVSVRLGRR